MAGLISQKSFRCQQRFRDIAEHHGNEGNNPNNDLQQQVARRGVGLSHILPPKRGELLRQKRNIPIHWQTIPGRTLTNPQSMDHQPFLRPSHAKEVRI
ncbi:hypothetical protein PSTG_17599 [Puccinia striiformis f. sp. tritici PST-78]|uniref:Uncharacterized protein n=1 Tax=Puccinia striiformis f. sp. tritici PST-78 TaxID=1165861 RepID=A0A0L0UQ93_9BASI|nr:hypothetical protein PSTG_17599 [Puccinia striiformis f. sp. tritici PST-78]